MRTADDAVGEAGLVLKQDDISVAAAGEHILKICVRQPAVCAAPDENAVLSAGVDLNDSVTGGNVKLEQMTGMKPVLWDERRTTIEAHQILNEGNYHGKKRKNTVDAVAASLILEGYLAYLRNHKE